jgi:hypothetical protein
LGERDSLFMVRQGFREEVEVKRHNARGVVSYQMLFPYRILVQNIETAVIKDCHSAGVIPADPAT